jgi:benzoyl-CoA 2,3-dioxygenase component B
MMSHVEDLERIPNNVNLRDNRRLLRALEEWQPRFLQWWREMGPDGFQADQVYLRTAVSVDAQGWAVFDYVRMPEYRWGIFLAEPEPDRRIGFGDHRGQPAWQEVPGEYRGALRRLVVTQGDTEPASVEQQRHLGRTCPSLYDLRNLFQVNVEEGRHLWAMVYLLHAYFGRDGREEAEALLERRSGDRDRPRILGAFNEPTPDWLSFFMFTFFTDRDGKYQLASLQESGFDPLSRTCRFMLTEEAHHMFVGETGVARVVQRTCELMRAHRTDDVRRYGGIDLPTIQKYLNFHYSVSLDLFGSEISTNAALYYTSGLKGRFEESRKADDHQLKEATYPVTVLEGDRIVTREVPALMALNERLRDDYIADCARGVARWNQIIRAHGIDFELRLPHRGFHRAIGSFAGAHVTPDGRVVSAEAWEAHRHEWLPTPEDTAYVASLMRPVVTPGAFAGWIAPPARGIHGKPLDFEYVKLIDKRERFGPAAEEGA